MSSNEYQIESFAYEWNWKQNKLKANWDIYFCLKWDWTWKREKSPISQLILLDSKDTEDFFLCPQSVTKWRANGDFFLFLKAWMILFVKTNHQWNLCYILIVSLKPDSDVLDVIVSHMDICKINLHTTSVIKLMDSDGDIFTVEHCALTLICPV